jgi:hypothetical protein
VITKRIYPTVGKEPPTAELTGAQVWVLKASLPQGGDRPCPPIFLGAGRSSNMSPELVLVSLSFIHCLGRRLTEATRCVCALCRRRSPVLPVLPALTSSRNSCKRVIAFEGIEIHHLAISTLTTALLLFFSLVWSGQENLRR